MKVLTRSVIIEGEEFVLIKDKHEDREYLGTIPYTELDENGRMKRELNGFEIAIEFVKDYKDLGACINGAIRRRKNQIAMRKFMEQNPNVTIQEQCEFIKSL